MRGHARRPMIPGIMAALTLLGIAIDPAQRLAIVSSGAEPLRGVLHLRVDDPANPHRRNLRLDQPGVLPIKAGDRFRIEVKLNHAAYLYLFWFGSDGKAAPIYPWAPGHWERRPVNETKTDRFELPPATDKAWEIPPGNPGIETLVLLARERIPLPRDIELVKLLSGLSGQRRLTLTLNQAVWLEDGREVIPDERDRAIPSPKARKSDDPVLRIRRLLQDKVQPLGDYYQVLVFPNQGGK